MKALTKAARSVQGQRKQAVPATMGFDRGWKPMGAYGGSGGSPAQAIKAINTYGGTDEASSTVFSCVSLIADTLAGYEWGLTDPDGELLDLGEDDELQSLLEEPWPEGTWNDFAGDVATDLELVGNSYWLKDQTNGFGQPLAIKRLTPGNVRIQTNKLDEKIGYVYRLKGVDVPFGIDDIIHYKLRNPLNPHYGMGTVEAIIREVQSDLSQSAHVTAFFTNGARIAGILTVPDGMDEVQFERLKDEVVQQYGSAHDAYKLLIAEKASDFKPISQPPVAAGVVELRKLAKNDILQGFGIPEFLLGGSNQGGVYKMGEAQFIFYRRMITRAQRFQDRTSLSLASLWEGRKFVLFPEMNEPPEQKIAHAEGLTKTGGTLNDSRVASGLPEIDDPLADIPLVLLLAQLKERGGDGANVTRELADLMCKAPRRSVGRTGRKRRHGALKAPPGRAPSVKLAPVPDTPPQQYDVEGTAVEVPIEKAAQEMAAIAELYAAALSSGLVQSELSGPSSTPAALEAPAEAVPEDGDVRFLIEAPALPYGYEQRAELVDPGEAEVVAAQQILQAQATFFQNATPRMYTAFVTFFNDQRMRVLARLEQHRSAHVRSGGKASNAHKSIEGDQLWDDDVEREALKAAYLAVADELGPQALEVPARVVNAMVTWDLEHEYVASAREALGELIVRINDTTRKAIAEQVEIAVSRGYSIPRIANGYADENFKGIQGVFNQASAARAETIARSETAMLYNRSATAAYRTAGVGQVQVFDGTGDSGCAGAAGSVWDVDRAEREPIEHPNCVRAFAPVVEA